MSLFQPSVLKKYLSQQDTALVQKAYKKYTRYFHNAVIQENIRNSKEEQFQEGFLRELFVDILGYTLNPAPSFNLTTELKNIKGAKKVDGAILKDGNALAVIELKGTNTKDLESIRQQAFDYKANQTGCIYVITSNFEKLRFYINNAVDYEEFNLFTLTHAAFEIFYLCLAKENILANRPLSIKEASVVEEENITKKFYGDYSVFKRELYRDLVKQNRSNILLNDLPEKTTKLILFQKSQKLIDRFLFILFAEDRGLLAPNSINTVLKEWKALADLDVEMPLYDRYKQYFGYLDTGRKGTDKKEEIFAYNGGLFQPDAILDAVIIDNELLYRHTLKLSTYDFESQVDVNILGHIFEHSLNEIESVNAEIEGTDFDKQKTKRKKDGVFYTPKYITKYIVDNTIGKLCTEKKQELGIIDEEYAKGRKNRQTTTIIKLDNQLKDYREWLLELTICDPACGSGAFLNQALDFLIKEHAYLDELNKQLFGGFFVFPDIENQILEHNIYGVDLNEESIEIAKLSLWLRTAQPKRKLTSLNNNIKCGNSLIDSKAIAGEKAFNWKEQFPEVFAKGGFDVIIGNPPYGDYFNSTEKTYLLKKFEASFSGTFDMYIMFFEVALNLIKSEGKLCYITPNTFIDYAQFSSLRKLLLKGNNIEQLISLTNVFEDAIVDTAIIILTKFKAQDENFRGINIKEKITSLESSIIPLLSSENLSSNGFILKSTGNFDIKKLIKNCPHKLSDILKITQGITTGGNDFFIGKKNYFIENGIPETIFKKVLKGKSIHRNKILFDDDYILYSTKKTDLDTQNKISVLLEQFKNKLSEKRETAQGNLPWYCLHWARDERDFNEPKILIRQTASHIIGVFDNDNYYSLDTLHTLNLKIEANDKVATLKFLLGILNSKLFKYLYSWKLDEGGKVYPQVKKINIEWLPIPILINENLISTNIDKLLEINLKEEQSRVKFLSFLNSKFNILNLNSKKLENWSELSFADFITELNKAIKTAGQTPLTKKDEFEWLDLFEENKTKAQNLKSQIETTEKAIDKMVYELYGLSEEEIEIVESN
ncbi:TaqI-like C-terminal specificity domain-containing protein [Flavobacterium sp. WC2421]|uniref:site-specific DNA-methyltransferase (adenine-specific) n=2 Tax=unclassified Flavobacterium TaxID=196869 RepID=A0AB39WA12_9FLAO